MGVTHSLPDEEKKSIEIDIDNHTADHQSDAMVRIDFPLNWKKKP